MLLKINNPTDETREKTSLSGPVNAGETQLVVLNTTGFSANDFIVIRKIGDEQTELRQISSVSAGTINVTSSVGYSHTTGIDVFKIPFNQIEISRKTSASGTFSVLATVDIQPDSLQTVYDDTNGQSTYFYRVRFFNSYSGQYSSYSGTLAGTGAATSQSGSMVDIVLHRVNDEGGDYTSRVEVLRELRLAFQQVYNAMIQSSSEFYLDRIEIPTESFKHEYTLPDNFAEVSEVRDGNEDLVPPTKRYDQYAEKGYELTGKNTIYFIDVPEPSSTSVTPLVVLANNAYDADGTWTADDDALNITTDNNEYKIGSGSINFDIDVSQDAANQATIYVSDMTAQDLSDYEDTGRWRVWVHIPDVTHINSVEMKWGSSTSVYWSLDVEKDYKNHAFHDGWNLIEFYWGDSSVTETGSPTTTDAEAVDYLALTIKYDSTQADEADFRVDAIQIATSWEANSIYEVSFFKQPDAVLDELTEFEIPEGYQFLLVDYAVAQILYRQGERDTLANKIMKSFEANISRLVSQSAKRTRRVIGFSHGHTRHYRSAASDSSTVVHSDGNVTRL